MAKVILNKKCFTNLAKGTHTVKVKFRDGYAEDTFEVKDKITFTVEGRSYTATYGMTFAEWVVSFNIGASSNGIVGFGSGATQALVYLDPKLFKDIYGDLGYDYFIGSDEIQLFENGETTIYASTVLRDGANYMLDPNYPR